MFEFLNGPPDLLDHLGPGHCRGELHLSGVWLVLQHRLHYVRKMLQQTRKMKIKMPDLLYFY